MLRKRIYNITILLTAIVIIFDISYLASVNRYRKVQGSSNEINHYNTYPANSGTAFANDDSVQTDIIGTDASMIFVMRNNKTNWEYTSSEEKVPQELIGKKKDYVENLYKDEGYKLDSITPEKVVFIKEVDGYNYEKNKYVLGISDGYMAIYKIDGKGNMSEIQVKNPKRVKDLPEGFQEMLLMGDSSFQFDSEQEARDNYDGCAS